MNCPTLACLLVISLILSNAEEEGRSEGNPGRFLTNILVTQRSDTSFLAHKQHGRASTTDFQAVQAPPSLGRRLVTCGQSPFW